jgi:hypothetical protein
MFCWGWYALDGSLGNLLEELRHLPGLPLSIASEASALEQAELAAVAAVAVKAGPMCAATSLPDVEQELLQHLVAAKLQALLGSLQLWQLHLERGYHSREQSGQHCVDVDVLAADCEQPHQSSCRVGSLVGQDSTWSTLQGVIQQLSTSKQRYQESGGEALLQQSCGEYKAWCEGKVDEVLEALLLQEPEEISARIVDTTPAAISQPVAFRKCFKDSLLLLELVPMLWPRGPVPMAVNLLVAWCSAELLGLPGACLWLKCCWHGAQGLTSSSETDSDGIGCKEGALWGSSESAAIFWLAFCEQADAVLLLKKRVEGQQAADGLADLFFRRDQWLQMGAIGMHPELRLLMEHWQSMEGMNGCKAEGTRGHACWDLCTDEAFNLGYAKQCVELEWGMRNLLSCMLVKSRARKHHQQGVELQFCAQDMLEQRQGLERLLQCARLAELQASKEAALVACAEGRASLSKAAGAGAEAAAGTSKPFAKLSLAGKACVESLERKFSVLLADAAVTVGPSPVPAEPHPASAICNPSLPSSLLTNKGGEESEQLRESEPANVERVDLSVGMQLDKAATATDCSAASCSRWWQCYQGVTCLLDELLRLAHLSPDLRQRASLVIHLEAKAGGAVKVGNSRSPAGVIQAELYLQAALAQGRELLKLLQHQWETQQLGELKEAFDEEQQQVDDLQLHNEEQDQEQIEQQLLKNVQQQHWQQEQQSGHIPTDLLEEVIQQLSENVDNCSALADAQLQEQLETYRAWWEEESLETVQQLLSSRVVGVAGSWEEAVQALAAVHAGSQSSCTSSVLSVQWGKGINLLCFANILWPASTPVLAALLLSLCQLTGLGPFAAAWPICMSGAAVAAAMKEASRAEEVQTQQKTEAGAQLSHGGPLSPPRAADTSCFQRASVRTRAMLWYKHVLIGSLLQKRVFGVPMSLSRRQFLQHRLKLALANPPDLDGAAERVARLWQQKEEAEEESLQTETGWNPMQDAVFMEAVAAFQQELTSELWEAGAVLLDQDTIIKAREQEGKYKLADKPQQQLREQIEAAVAGAFTALRTSQEVLVSGKASMVEGSASLSSCTHSQPAELLGLGVGDEGGWDGGDLQAGLTDQQEEQEEAGCCVLVEQSKHNPAVDPKQQLLCSSVASQNHQQQDQSDLSYLGLGNCDGEERDLAAAAPASALALPVVRSTRNLIGGAVSPLENAQEAMCSCSNTHDAVGLALGGGLSVAEVGTPLAPGQLAKSQSLQLQQLEEQSQEGWAASPVEGSFSSKCGGLEWFAAYEPSGKHIQSFLLKHKGVPDDVRGAAGVLIALEDMTIDSIANSGSGTNGAGESCSCEVRVRLDLQQHLLRCEGKTLLSFFLRMLQQKQKEQQQQQHSQQRDRAKRGASAAHQAATNLELLLQDSKQLCSQLLSNQQRFRQARAEEQFKQQQSVYQAYWQQRAHQVLTTSLLELEQAGFDGATSAVFKEMQELCVLLDMLWHGKNARPLVAVLLLACCNLVSNRAVAASETLHQRWNELEEVVKAAGQECSSEHVCCLGEQEQLQSGATISASRASNWAAFWSISKARQLLGDLLTCGNNISLLQSLGAWLSHVAEHCLPTDSPTYHAMMLWYLRSEEAAAAQLGAAMSPAGFKGKARQRLDWKPSADKELLTAKKAVETELKPALLQVVSVVLSAVKQAEEGQWQRQKGCGCDSAVAGSLAGQSPRRSGGRDCPCNRTEVLCFEPGGGLSSRTRNQKSHQQRMEWEEQEKQQGQTQQQLQHEDEMEQQLLLQSSPWQHVEVGRGQGASACRRREQVKQLTAPWNQAVMQSPPIGPAATPEQLSPDLLKAGGLASRDDSASSKSGVKGGSAQSEKQGFTTRDAEAAAGVADQLLALWEAVNHLCEAEAEMHAQNERIDMLMEHMPPQGGYQKLFARLEICHAQISMSWKALVGLAAARQQLRMNLGLVADRVPPSVFDGNLRRADAKLLASKCAWGIEGSSSMGSSPKQLDKSGNGPHLSTKGDCFALDGGQSKGPAKQEQQEEKEGLFWRWDGTGDLCNGKEKLPVVRGPLGAALPQVLLLGLSGAEATADLPPALTKAIEMGHKHADAKLAVAVELLMRAEVELGKQQLQACELAAMQLLLQAGVVERTLATAAGTAEVPLGLLGLVAAHSRLPMAERKKVGSADPTPCLVAC